MWKFNTFTHMVLFIMFILYENTFLGCIRGCYKLWNMFKIVRFDRYMNLKVDLPFMVYSPISFELCKVGQKTFCWKGFDHSERKGPKLKHEWITLIRWNELCAHAIKCRLSSPYMHWKTSASLMDSEVDSFREYWWYDIIRKGGPHLAQHWFNDENRYTNMSLVFSIAKFS